MATAKTPAQVLPEWIGVHCSRYANLAFDLAWWFLYAALAIGVLGALLSIYWAIKNPSPAKPDSEGGGGGAMAVVTDAVAGLVNAFAKAPAWIAMLGAGLILLWFAGEGVPTYCVPHEQQQTQSHDSAADSTGADAAGKNTANGTEGEGGG